ncbi:MAG: cation:proton antiporter [Gammaproteobacteria bacterium]|nr:cation:proton antiporter [Gammaproteobacteria bacterium]
MDTSTAILHVATILIAARIMGEVVARFGIPSVIGEIVAGIILGPSMFGLIEAEGLIWVLAEIGIILLLFQIGLETDLSKLVKSGTKSVVVAITGFIVPFVTCFALSYYWFGLDQIVSLLIAGTMTATSIGITMRTLSDLGRGQSREGRIILGAAVLDDIMGVLLLAILFNFITSGSVDIGGAARILLFMVVFFLIAPAMAKSISFIIHRWEKVSGIPGMIPTTVVSLVLFLAWISHAVGIPELLGGFATGLALSRRFFLPFGVALKADPKFSKRVNKQMQPIIQLFTPIFFAAVGLSLDLSSLDWSSLFFWIFSLSLAAVAILSKIFAGLLIRERLAQRVIIGMSMVPRGEVGLVFAEIGRHTGLFNTEIYTTVVIVIAYTTLFTPFWLRLFYKFYGHLLDEDSADQQPVRIPPKQPRPG